MQTDKTTDGTGSAVTPDHTAEIERLAKLSTIEYDRARDVAADKLEIRLPTLDDLVAAQRRKAAPVSADQNVRGILQDVLPWPAPVEGSDLITAIVAELRRFTVMPQGADVAIALWVIFAHAHDAADHSPILALESPEKRCGKTTTLGIIADLVPRQLPAANISPAALFRSVEKFRPTLLIDEGDTFLRDNEEMRGVLNSGFTEASAYVIRCDGDDNDPRPFRTWCPKLIAAIGTLPSTLQDRAIVITLRRKLETECVERFGRQHRKRLHELRAKAVRWAADHRAELTGSDPVMPKGLNDRAADCWRPLLAIADATGGQWPDRARVAARALSGAGDDDDAASAGVLLLQHIRDVFTAKNAKAIQSSALAEALNANEQWPWGEWRHGKPISPRGVARILGRFGIRPAKAMHANEYRIADFTDAWKRYASLSSSPPGPLSSISSTHREFTCVYSELSEYPSIGASSTAGIPMGDLETAENPITTGVLEDMEVADPVHAVNGYRAWSEMHPVHALAALHELGLSLQPISGGRLYVAPRERITPDARHLIVVHRDALVDLVRRRQANIDPADLLVTYEERLAICFEAGDVSETEAHRLATEQCGFTHTELSEMVKHLEATK